VITVRAESSARVATIVRSAKGIQRATSMRHQHLSLRVTPQHPTSVQSVVSAVSVVVATIAVVVMVASVATMVARTTTIIATTSNRCVV
jgi:hypothetical protein